LRALSDLSCVPKILLEGHTGRESLALLTDFVGQPLESWISDNGNIDDYTLFQIILDLLSCLEKIHAHDYMHGDVAIRNVIHRNGHFYLIDFGLATMLQLYLYPCQAIVRDYNELCQIIGIIKFGKKMSLLELTDKLDGELKQFVATIEDASRWKITDEEKWLKKFGAKVKQLHHSPRKMSSDTTENINIL
jgi:serine/threonine protein kinase